MKNKPLNQLLAAIAISFAFAIPAFAGGIAGVWKSDSGNTITIPPSKTDFKLVFVNPEGKISNFDARWVEGQKGKQFTYRNKAGEVSCTLNPSNEDQLFYLTPDGKQRIWVREASSR